MELHVGNLNDIFLFYTFGNYTPYVADIDIGNDDDFEYDYNNEEVDNYYISEKLIEPIILYISRIARKFFNFFSE